MAEEIKAIKKLSASNSQTNSAKRIMDRGAKALAANQLDEARANYTNALNVLTNAYGRDNVERIVCLRGLAAIESRRENPAGAEKLLREALALARTQKAILMEGPVVAEIFDALAQQRRYAEGATLFQECQPLIDNQALPPSPRLAVVRQARSFFQKQNEEHADPVLEHRIADLDAKVKVLEASLRH